MKKVALLGIFLLLLISSLGIGDDTCLIPPDEAGGAFTSFIAPVIPPSNTTSGQFAYLALFRPTGQNLWEGDVEKFGLDEEGNFIDANGEPALDAEGNIKPTAQPFWAARDWADPLKTNYVHNWTRKIYTYLGLSYDLTDSSNEFRASNSMITPHVLGDPQHSVSDIINYIRGADVLDENGDHDTTENRSFILGDVMHSTPLVVRYKYADGTSETYVFFGANDGMLHAVRDMSTNSNGNITHYGEEAWAFIPPDQLHKLKDLVEGDGHTYFVDASPKAFVIDENGDGILDPSDGDRIILICGERKGGRSYFALDITDPTDPLFLWRISQSNDAPSLHLPAGAAPNVIIPELGQTWSEPIFGRVKTSDEDAVGTPVFFIGAGFSPDNSAGRAILAINPLDGSLVKRFKNGISGSTWMYFSIPSTVAAIDEDGNGFTDKLYVGDIGGQMWRVGKFTNAEGDPRAFPEADENILSWKAHRLFTAPSIPQRPFFYPPSVVFEGSYDLLLTGTGNREDPCDPNSADRIYAIKDMHDNTTLTELDLVDVTDLQSATNPPALPDLDNETADVDDNGYIDRGWFIRLATGEKVLEKGLVFNKVYYVTTFTPDVELGISKLYAINYKTGAPALFTQEGNDTWGRVTGVGIPSRPVMYIGQSRIRLFTSTGTSYSSTGGGGGGTTSTPEAAILAIEPVMPPSNFFYLWWMVI